ncbi:type II toxin-antitoxin system death-on-curing family toxin [Xanthomonas cassavae CFBP 4642]|uniref:Type II toxin-antitoxin system death-on-curing family toxin n=1 Tax=Xanthomonas cassavae CFBP 4642 TaxID=1219375 RepID=A0ABS8HHR1_9XANT|nr:type II toxin-antitoxin system death-on-curing family toxin [Xanthomonas cassavae]MCC4620871.1 type II toxin-antitoxin system death-on-curing family toxin [Xanthomonas cassavae CFBP 4642]
MIIWIERPLVLAIHDRQLAEHGGGSGVRDDALLDSALTRPRQLLSYGDPPPDLAALAASLTYGLARNHPFVDGNKRTAAVACETFIVLNGASLVADDLELYRFYIGLADGSLDEAACAAWLRPRLQVRHSQRINESMSNYG